MPETAADVHAGDATVATVLLAAAYGNHVDAARELIDADADVNAKTTLSRVRI